VEIQPFETAAAGALGVIALVMGWVQLSKQLGVKDKQAVVLTLVLGVILGSLREAMAQGLIPPSFLPWISVVIVGIGAPLSAMGLYKLGKFYTNGGPAGQQDNVRRDPTYPRRIDGESPTTRGGGA